MQGLQLLQFNAKLRRKWWVMGDDQRQNSTKHLWDTQAVMVMAMMHQNIQNKRINRLPSQSICQYWMVLVLGDAGSSHDISHNCPLTVLTGPHLATICCTNMFYKSETNGYIWCIMMWHFMKDGGCWLSLRNCWIPFSTTLHFFTFESKTQEKDPRNPSFSRYDTIRIVKRNKHLKLHIAIYILV